MQVNLKIVTSRHFARVTDSAAYAQSELKRDNGRENGIPDDMMADPRAVAAVRQKRSQKFQYHDGNAGNIGSSETTMKSRYCGRLHRYGKQFCPAANQACKKCGQKGYFAAVCMKKNVHKVSRSHLAFTDSGDEESYIFIANSNLAGNFKQIGL